MTETVTGMPADCCTALRAALQASDLPNRTKAYADSAIENLLSVLEPGVPVTVALTIEAPPFRFAMATA